MIKIFLIVLGVLVLGLGLSFMMVMPVFGTAPSREDKNKFKE